MGDIVVSDFVTHHDVDVTAFDYAYGQVPGMPAMYEADPALVEKAMQAVGSTKARAAKGIIATGDSFMQDPERVALVRSRFPEMIAAEMEAAAIFILSSIHRVRAGGVMMMVATDEGLPDNEEEMRLFHSDRAIRTAIESLKILIKKDREAG